MKRNKLKEKGIERLEDVRFWLAVLRKFDQFSKPQRKKIDKAYHLINEIYESPKPKPKPKPEKSHNAGELGIF
jgi:hypothetical protein